ncbi:transcriptional regulator NarL [Hartmannibacter diazotrophicus]|uniref:Transcriptional regulator NarL n=1 Tax=Hartmannibacter diazotrophicus TaxID=1482074 RepID=A0A2C9D4M7_9HYPH|nr:LuxR C-terminal-related transcriptional regulator [Hartmannibacter diazotrophicus]SON55287.1 transcriptional regulator NarL [Hartmannibacter diazotrophicus]
MTEMAIVNIDTSEPTRWEMPATRTSAPSVAKRSREVERGEVLDDLLRLGEDDVEECLASLTTMQRLVLQHLACGYLNKQIAYRCGISLATTKSHISQVIHKMRSHCRTEAAVKYALHMQRQAHTADLERCAKTGACGRLSEDVAM